MRNSMRLIGFVAAAVGAAACGGGSNGGNNGGTTGPTQVTTSAGTPVGPAVTKSIGAAGGTLVFQEDGKDRVTVSVPAGAVSSSTTFSVQPISVALANSIGASYLIEPHGVTFATPVSITYSVPSAGVSHTGLGGLEVAYREDDGHWRLVTSVTRNEAAKTITASMTHFCPTSLLEDVQLIPTWASVKEGNTATITVIVCNGASQDDWKPTPAGRGIVMNAPSSGQPAVYSCTPGASMKATNWSVNNIPGGNSTVGTVVSTGDYTATYTAPAHKPNPSEVAVNATVNGDIWFEDPNSSLPVKWPFENVLVLSKLNIGGPATFQGNFSVSSSGVYNFTAGGQATITPHIMSNGQYDDGIDMTNYDLTYTATIDNNITVSGVPCTPTQATKTYSHVNDVTILKIPPRMDWHLTMTWNVTCNQNGQQIPAVVSLGWRTYCTARVGVDDGTWGVPLSDIDHPSGSYTLYATPTCDGAISTQTVTWDFQRIEPP
jgi:hypothetical protein